MNKTLLNTKETADYLTEHGFKITESGLSTARCRGCVTPKYRKYGGRVLYHLNDLKNFLDSFAA